LKSTPAATRVYYYQKNEEKIVFTDDRRPRGTLPMTRQFRMGQIGFSGETHYSFAVIGTTVVTFILGR